MTPQNNQRPAPAPRIGLYFISANRNSYLISKTLCLAGAEVFVRSEMPVDELTGDPKAPNPVERRYCSWLYSEPAIHAVTHDVPLPEVDILLFEISSLRPRFPRALSAWQGKAARAIAWNTNDHESSLWGNLRGELACVKHYWKFLPRAKKVILSSGRLNLRPTAMVCPTLRQGYFVHPNFYREAPLFQEMFEGDCAGNRSRPLRLVFSGNPEPESRRRLIGGMLETIQRIPDTQILRHYKELARRQPEGNARLVLWMVREDSHDPQWFLRSDVVPPAKWPSVLRQCDFVFCPPGYEKKTHRVVESLLQGVIPILDCPEEYDISLADGKNCLRVANNHWKEAIERALKMAPQEVARMRAAVIETRNAYLTPVAAGRNWLSKLGLVSANGYRRASFEPRL